MRALALLLLLGAAAHAQPRLPWGRYDNSVPGYRAHGLYLSHPYWGRTPNDRTVYLVGSKKPRGDNNARLTYDRFGRPVYKR